MIDFEIKVTNEGGDADAHRLRLADAADMYAGLGRAISYCLISLEIGALAEKATRKASVQVYQRKTGDKCIFHELIVEISQHPGAFYAGIAGNIAADQLKEFVKFCFKSAAGLTKDGDRIPQLVDRVEPFFDELTIKIEPHLLAAHSPIQQDETIAIDLGGDAVLFDAETKDFLSGSNISAQTSDIAGVVTRLNIVTGNGRYYSDALGRIAPFSQAAKLKSDPASKNLWWSLRERDQDRQGVIIIKARKITSNTGRLKRLIVENAEMLKDASAIR